MRFNPVSEEKAAAQSSGVWEDGIYDYEIKDASEETSRAGNDMIKLEVWIFNQAGNRKLLFEYLVASEKAAWKVREFAASSGLLTQYDTGTLIANEIVGRTGMCEVGIQPERDGYPEKNVVRRWMMKDKPKAPSAAQKMTNNRVKSPAGPDLDDEIPF
jgi:hypothetical protein